MALLDLAVYLFFFVEWWLRASGIRSNTKRNIQQKKVKYAQSVSPNVKYCKTVR